MSNEQTLVKQKCVRCGNELFGDMHWRNGSGPVCNMCMIYLTRPLVMPISPLQIAMTEQRCPHCGQLISTKG